MIEVARCSRRYCGSIMTVRVLVGGHVEYHCVPCALNHAGKCRDCRASFADKNRRRRMRCEQCSYEFTRQREREYDRVRYAEQHEHRLAQCRRSSADPSRRERKRAAMRRHRALNPRDHLDRAYNRVNMQQRRSDPDFRANENARKRELRALRKAQRSQPEQIAA
jgi:hypothetical protein